MKLKLTVRVFLSVFLVAGANVPRVHGQSMPREDVVAVPAIGEGLCVSNAFQTNMVIQRDKPIRVWGWADPGEEVTVEFAGRKASTQADKDRSWTVSLPASPANAAHGGADRGDRRGVR